MFSSAKLSLSSIMIVVSMSVVLIGGAISSPNALLRASADKDKGCDTPGTHHDDNNPSEKQFKKMTDYCQMAICVDVENCTNGDKMSKWQQEKIIASADEKDEKNCLKKASQDGHGKDGLVGYEVLDCADGKY